MGVRKNTGAFDRAAQRGRHLLPLVSIEELTASTTRIVETAAAGVAAAGPTQQKAHLEFLRTEWTNMALQCDLGEVGAAEQVDLLIDYVLDLMTEMKDGELPVDNALV